MLAFRRRAQDPALTLAIRVGLLLLLIAMVGGGAMTSVGNNRAESGQIHDFVQWGPAGNMKVTHALAIHGVQFLSRRDLDPLGLAVFHRGECYAKQHGKLMRSG